MNAFYSLAVLALASGQPPATERPSVLVLDDYKLLEGQVAQIPDYRDPSGETKLYRVASAGTIQTLPAKAVLFHGASRQEAYQFVKGKWNPTTADRRIQLAEWCRDAGLISEALAEAKASARAAPPDPYLVKMIHELESAKAKMPDERTVKIVRPAPPKTPAPAPTVLPSTKLLEKPVTDPAVEKFFGLKIQTILMNQCVACHADPKQKTKFVLTRVPEGETVGATTSRNLAAATAQVSGEKPGQSPLLVFAVGPHGGQQQASLTVQHPAYQNLSAWVSAVAAGLPSPPPSPKSVPFAANSSSPPAALPPTPPRPAPPAAPGMPKIKVAIGPDAADPFDPAEFNKTAAPAKKP